MFGSLDVTSAISLLPVAPPPLYSVPQCCQFILFKKRVELHNNLISVKITPLTECLFSFNPNLQPGTAHVKKNDNPYSYWSLASPCSNVSNISQNSLEIRVVPLVRSNCCRLLHSLRRFKISEVKTVYSACIDKTSENRL